MRMLTQVRREKEVDPVTATEYFKGFLSNRVRQWRIMK
jgi:hypothetical protein